MAYLYLALKNKEFFLIESYKYAIISATWTPEIKIARPNDKKDSSSKRFS